jgi:protein-tyrosine phosphatase
VDSGVRVNEVALTSRLRGVPNRVLHPLRRRRALAALRRHPRVASLLVVCHGNLCRSPFAAELLRAWLSERGVRVDSAGFSGTGRRSPPEAVAAAARFGIDLSAHRSQSLTVHGARAADLIVVMDSAQRSEVCDRFGRSERDVLLLGDLDPEPGGPRTIPDPVNQPLAVFEETYARIARCARELERGIG